METLTRETDEMGMRDIGIQLESTGSHLDERKGGSSDTIAIRWVGALLCSCCFPQYTAGGLVFCKRPDERIRRRLNSWWH